MGAQDAADEAVETCDSLLGEIRTSISDKARIPPLRHEPDDPWAGELSVPPNVWKERCTKTGYLLTRPFETVCPLRAGFNRDAKWLDGMLNPTVRPKGSEQSKEQDQESGKKGGETQQEEADFDQVLLKVGRIDSLHEDPSWSEKLYVAHVDIGEQKKRQIVAGLRGRAPRSELESRLVVVVANLKKQKLGGEPSEGMILACESSQSVSPLRPPESASPGDRVYLQGKEPAKDPPKECRNSHWQAIQAHLESQGDKAAFRNVPLACSSGSVSAPGDKGSPIK